MSDSRTQRGDQRASVPLCVDLDDSLARTDVLWEATVQLLRHPFVALRAVLVLLSNGKAAFKETLAARIPFDAAAIPYNDAVVDYIRSQRAAGREVVLATATHHVWAQRVAEHLGVFSAVLATESTVNLSGERKRDALISRYKEKGYDYIGDHRKDLPVFKAAREALLVNPSASLLRDARAAANVTRVFSDTGSRGHVLARALRLHQWSKNVLLALPLISAHQLFNLQAGLNVAIAFVSFGLVASATYLVNDLLDLHADRNHPQKKSRPLASGGLSVKSTFMLIPLLGCAGFLLPAATLPAGFTAYLGVYVLITLAYSLYLKRRLLVDAITLAMLYTLRILAGGAAAGVLVSEWLLMFSLFIFLSLAFVKRIVELGSSSGTARVSGRGYSAVDLETVRVIGISSGLLSVLVLALYVNSPAVSLLYRAPQLLWLVCPLLIYWIARVWFLAARGELHHDPVVFALSDWRSYVVGACALTVIALAKISPSAIHL